MVHMYKSKEMQRADFTDLYILKQVNKKFFEFKNVAYRDGIKSKETRQG